MRPPLVIEEHLFLAELIAFDYANIPGCSLGEARSEANLGLLRAAEAYDPAKGEFIPFASKIIRNSLNTLYAKQLRMLKIFPRSLDEPIPKLRPTVDGLSSDGWDQPAAAAEVQKELRQREAGAALEAVMNLLTPRERVMVEALRLGKSYSEIGETLRISKQAAHKTSRSALEKLRGGLERLGFNGIASDGLLASRNKGDYPGPG